MWKFLSLSLLFGEVSSATVSSGEDYWLPEDVADSGGFFRPGNVMDEELAAMIGYSFGTFYWSQVNPSDGVFDFSVILDKLQVASQQNRGFIMRFKVAVIHRKTGWDDSDVPYIPQWVLDTCQPATCYAAGSSSSSSFFYYAVLWDACSKSTSRWYMPLQQLEFYKTLLLLVSTSVVSAILPVNLESSGVTRLPE